MTAPGTRFACPQCGLKLRIQAESAIERRIACPGCQTHLRVRFEPQSGTVQVQPAEAVVPPTPPAAPAEIRSQNSPGAATALPPRESSPDNSPAQGDLRAHDPPVSDAPSARRRWLFGGGLLALIVGGIGVWSLQRPSGDRPHAPDSSREVAQGEPSTTSVPPPPGTNDTDPTGTTDGNLQQSADPRSDPARPVQERLEGLRTTVMSVVEQTGRFPPAVVGDPSRSFESRLSWLAFLAHQTQDRSPPVDWSSDWNMPVNDRFVRRRLAEFQNPLIPQLTGDDGYPASHFVGIAGVGPEVFRPDPPADQVGVFVPDRLVSLPQIRDGLAQTAVVTGVQSQLGSWGAGGRPTIRSFQSPPMIGGPDGLGTGQAESLLLLMADGRVQSVGVDVDPEVFRRMLTIAGEGPAESPDESTAPTADELPVPDSAAVDPPPTPSLVESQPMDDDADHPPLSPQFAGDDEQPRRQLNPQVALAQRLIAFEQPVRSRREVLQGVRDLLGVPLRFEGVDVEARLRDRVGFTLREVTVQQVLERTLADSGLSWRIDRGQLVVFMADSPSGKR